jgi:tetratricopeptide (TPR) repeat protein
MNTKLLLAATALLLSIRTTTPRSVARPHAVKVTAPAVAPAPAAAPAPLVTFADPDGQELVLEELSVRTAIHGMLSLTELELRFRNPQARRIEGRFTCTLPHDAAISRFAKEINGSLMEGEVVERLRANQVYEQFLHQMRDPALLEQDQGNRFSARIFPIDPNAPVRLLVSYTQLLPMRGGIRTYALPLRGLPKVNKLTFRGFVTPVPGEETEGKLTTSTAEVTRFDERDWTPDRDLVMTWQATAGAPRARILRAGDFYVAAFRPPVAQPKVDIPHAWLFYIDTSASSAESAPHRIRALEQLLGALPPNDSVRLVAFDQELAPLANGTASDLAPRVGDLLRNRLFLGGTDLSALLRDLAHNAGASRNIVVASDLVATLGETESHQLTSAIAALPRGARVHALILGAREEASLARTLTAGRGRVVRVPFTATLDTNAREAARLLQAPLGASFDASDPAAEWLYPTHFDDVADGDEILVLGKTRVGSEPQVSVASERANGAQRLDASTFGPLLEREAYRAYLEYLAAREASEPSEAVRRALGTEQVRISTEQRVVIPRTTMLVLETEWDYQRFGLDRRALAAILSIDAGGIGRVDHRDPLPPGRPMPMAKTMAPARVAPPNAAPREDAAPTERLQDAVKEEGVQGGVEGGVVGSVMGGVAGGVVGGVVDARNEARDAVSVNAAAPAVEPASVAQQRAAVDAPRPVPAPPAPPPPTAQMRQRVAPTTAVASDDASNWTKQALPPRARVDELEAQLKNDPRDREVYNQLGETLAALREWPSLRRLALRWQPYDPENPQVYELLGMADEHDGNASEAARAYASLIELALAKPELLQRAGLLLVRIGRASIAEAPLRRALELRPDRANGYRSLALLLWQDGRIEEAARLLESGTTKEFPGWYGNVHRVLREELGYVYRAWQVKEPSRRNEIADRAREHDVDLARRDALRITLAWETDANDVDLHVVEPTGTEVYYSNPRSSTGLELYEDITQGLGPEVIRASHTERGVYHVGVRYFAAGPMGISRGIVVIQRGDDKVEIEPFRLAEGGGEIRYVAAVKMQ